MELRQLKYFVTVAKTLNFSEAAKRLFITQGTLSQQICQLEGELGVQLFHRTSHSVSLTEEGEEMLPIAIRTIESSEECIHKVTDLKKSLSGSLNIGLTSSFRDLLTDTVRTFVKQYPGVNLHIVYRTATELIELLEGREVDFILAFKPAAEYDHIVSEQLFVSDLSVVMHKNHPLADKKILTRKDLEHQRMMLPGSGQQARKAFESFNNLNMSDFNIVMELNDPNIIMELLHGTGMVSVMSSLATYYDPSLVAIPLEHIQKKMIGCVHWLRGAYRKRSAEKFIDILKDSLPLGWTKC